MKVLYYILVCVLSIIAISSIRNVNYMKLKPSLWKVNLPARSHMFDGVEKRLDRVGFRLPQCENILNNLTIGKWVKDPAVTEKLRLKNERAFRQELSEFWNKRGIQTRLWRPDLKCGYMIPQEKPVNSSWETVGSWCNKDGETPCCDNIHTGQCSYPSEASCECPTCTDMRKYEFENQVVWKVKDNRCIWQNYSSEDACHIIASSPFRQLYFVGDSHIRNMVGAFLALLKNDPVRGSWEEVITNKSWIRTCSGPERFFWKQCRAVPKFSLICSKYTDKKITLSRMAMLGRSNNFDRLLERTLGEPRSLFIFGVGIHYQCDPQFIISEYLQNVIRKKHEQLFAWPKIIFVSPSSAGHLKPSRYWKTQNDLICGECNRVLKDFCNSHGIPYIDIMALTKNIISFDGTHYTYEVNYMKIQMLLNYLSSTYPSETK